MPTDHDTSSEDSADGVPNDNTSLTAVLSSYAAAGFASSFSTTEDSQILCEHCNRASDPGHVAMSSLRRLEGASDPADMCAVLALTCPHCDVRGVAVLGFGPMASAEDGDVLRALRDHRADTQLPGNSAPGEAVGDDAESTSG